MAVLKQIKFGTDNATPIAQTVVTAASDSVLSVNGTHTDLADNNDPSYEVDLRIDNATLVKSSDSDKVLKVGTVPAAQVSVADDGGKLTATNVEAALAELDDKITSTGNVAKKYKVVSVDSPAGTSLAEYKLQVAEGTSETYADVTGSANIVVPKDRHLKSVVLTDKDASENEGSFMKFTYVLNDGNESDVYVNLGDFLTEAEFGDGLQVTNHVVSVKIDPTSEKFLTVGKDGVKLDGVQNAIDAKVAALNVVGSVGKGQYVSSVSETNGIVSTTKANVSDAVLNGYAKGEKPTSTAIADTDDVKGALAKLEHQVDAAKAAATTKVAKGNAVSHLTLTSSTAADGSTTYTIGESDIASKTVLDAEIVARKAVDGQTGDTYAVNGNTNYISGAKSLNDADVKLDAALKVEADRAKSAETSIDTAIGLTKSGDNETRTYTNTGVYIGKGESKTVASDIKALDTQLKKVTDDLAKVQYKVNGTTLEFFGISLKTV